MSVVVAPADVEFFRREGYWVCRQPLFAAPKLRKLQETFEKILAAAPPDKRPEDLDVPHWAHPELFEWLLAKEALDVVESFIGPDIALFSSHFICKPPGVGRAVPWHEDSAYWKGLIEPSDVITIWLALDDSTRENGCMRVIPQTHGHGFSEYETVDREKFVFGARIKADQFDESKAVDLELRPGEFHLHHAKLIHGSNANTSPKRRCGYTMRYMPTTVKLLNREGRALHRIFLARGRDRAGNAYADATSPNAEPVRRA